VGADQLELIVRRDAGVDEEVGDYGNDCSTEIHQERRQPGERLKNHYVTPNLRLGDQICTDHSSGRGKGGFNPKQNPRAMRGVQVGGVNVLGVLHEAISVRSVDWGEASMWRLLLRRCSRRNASNQAERQPEE